jgi:hypothetical protein
VNSIETNMIDGRGYKKEVETLIQSNKC